MSPTARPAVSDAPLLRITAVTHRFDRRPVLSGIHLSLSPGELLVVAGPNGAGKSTLLRIAAGLLTPTSGRVERAPGTIGYAAPDLEPWGELSGRENLDCLARIRGEAGAGAEAVAWLIEAGFPSSLLAAPGATLSTGLRQRLKLAMARLGRPGLLVLDEPMSNLDEEGRLLVIRLVDEARRDGAVLLATSDAALAVSGGTTLALRVLA
ncbi:MAG: heme exporter protein CcmA [bacterium]|nr:MAG: heme exporter protein CcmA [bacterium]